MKIEIKTAASGCIRLLSPSLIHLNFYPAGDGYSVTGLLKLEPQHEPFGGYGPEPDKEGGT